MRLFCFAEVDKTEQADCHDFLKQPLPKFRIGKKYKLDEKALVWNVSVAPEDNTKKKMLALGCQLGARHAKEGSFDLYVVNSSQAAEHYMPGSEGNVGGTRIYANYFFNREKNWHKAYWRPSTDQYSYYYTVEIQLGDLPPQPSKN